jgi:hypothetical protein
MTSRFFKLTLLTLIISIATACSQSVDNANSPLMVAASHVLSADVSLTVLTVCFAVYAYTHTLP